MRSPASHGDLFEVEGQGLWIGFAKATILAALQFVDSFIKAILQRSLIAAVILPGSKTIVATGNKNGWIHLIGRRRAGVLFFGALGTS